MHGIGANSRWGDPETAHELWLATQSAYNRYQNASSALDALMAMSSDVAASERNLHVEAAAGIQRTAFENYIEARLQLGEFMLSTESTDDVPEADVTGEDGHQAPTESKISGRILRATVAALLCLTALGLRDLARERGHSRDLENAREEVSAALNQAQSEVQDLAHQVEALKAAELAVPPSARAAVARVRTDHGRLNQTAARLTQSGRPISRNHKELQKSGWYREFTLTPGKHSERIGPMGLTLVRVDPRHQAFDLSIAVDNLVPQKKRMTIYEPVWFDWSGRPGAVEVVVTRVNRDLVQGYLSTPKYSRLPGERRRSRV
jgi:hypothetical protein